MEINKKTPLSKILKLASECKQCGYCCNHGAGFVLKDEIKALAKHFKLKEDDFIEKYLDETRLFDHIVYKFKTKKEKSKHYGVCILYKEGIGCTIHKIKPLHCKIGNCNKYGQELSAWFTVNYLVKENDPEAIRQFNIYIISGGKTIPGGELKDVVPDKKTLKKILDFKILR
jgi:Fe-S-cluster containining protein